MSNDENEKYLSDATYKWIRLTHELEKNTNNRDKYFYAKGIVHAIEAMRTMLDFSISPLKMEGLEKLGGDEILEKILLDAKNYDDVEYQEYLEDSLKNANYTYIDADYDSEFDYYYNEHEVHDNYLKRTIENSFSWLLEMSEDQLKKVVDKLIE